MSVFSVAVKRERSLKSWSSTLVGYGERVSCCNRMLVFCFVMLCCVLLSLEAWASNYGEVQHVW